MRDLPSMRPLPERPLEPPEEMESDDVTRTIRRFRGYQDIFERFFDSTSDKKII